MSLISPHFDTPRPDASISTAFTRRAFIATSSALLLGGEALLNAQEPDSTFDQLRHEEEAQRKELVGQSANVMRKTDSRIAVHWPENTAVYAATVQSWPAWPDIHTDRPYFFQEIEKNFSSRDVHTLDQAARMLKEGWCWPYVPYTPQVPTFTAAADVHSGWDTRDRDKKRFVLVISGEGSRSSSDEYEDSYFEKVRGELKEWSQKNPLVYHKLDQLFIEHLAELGLDDAVDQYRGSLKEEKRFLDGGLYMKGILQDQFHFPDRPEHVQVLPYPTLAAVVHTFDKWVKPRQAADSELVIIYNGHGVVKDDVADAAPQGQAEGLLCINNAEKLHEARLKQLVRQCASEFGAVSILIDACHSGAFVA